MKVKTARSTLSLIWIICSLPIIVIVILQSLNQVYDDAQNWDKGWLWISPLLFPILGTIIGSWSVGHNNDDNFRISSTSSFWLTTLLSLVYFSVLYGALMVGSFTYHHRNWDFIMRSTGWFLGTFQALITIALTKFFIENIRPAPSSNDPTP